MKQIKKLGLVVVTLLLSATMAFAAKPNIHILATGGTIAGTGSSATGTSYTAGQVAIGALLDAVPEIKDKSSCQYKDEYGKHGGTFVLDIFNLYLLVIEKTFFQAFLILGILYQFFADFHGE